MYITIFIKINCVMNKDDTIQINKFLAKQHSIQLFICQVKFV